MADKFGPYIQKLMTTVLDKEQDEFVVELAWSELHRLNIDIKEFSIKLFNFCRPDDLNLNMAVSNKNAEIESFSTEYIIENNKKKAIKAKPYKYLKNLIEKFNFPLPKSLPPICSLLSGYFSYDTIRYLEKIPNKCKDDLKLPDVRLLRPRTLVIHDNLKKKIFYIINISMFV